MGEEDIFLLVGGQFQEETTSPLEEFLAAFREGANQGREGDRLDTTLRVIVVGLFWKEED